MDTRLTDYGCFEDDRFEESEPESIEITITGAKLERHVRIAPEEEMTQIYPVRSRNCVSKVFNRIKTYLANA